MFSVRWKLYTFIITTVTYTDCVHARTRMKIYVLTTCTQTYFYVRENTCTKIFNFSSLDITQFLEIQFSSKNWFQFVNLVRLR